MLSEYNREYRIYIYGSFRFVLVVQKVRFRAPRQRRGTTPNLGSVGAERQPGGPCWCPVGASRRRAGLQILSHRFLFGNCAWPGPVGLLRRAGQSELVFRADEMQVFSGRQDLTGAGFSFFWADGGAQRHRRVFIRRPCGGRAS